MRSSRDLAAALRSAGVEADFSTRRRAEYSADASNYRHVPLGVAFPRDADQVDAALAACRSAGVPVTLRGGGTSVAGNAVGEGLVVDFSRYFARVLSIAAESRTARVEPGVVLSSLQAALAAHRLRFGPDPSTASRCTIGGMIGNNACGARSLAWGTTADNVVGLDLLLADGSRVTASRGSSGSPAIDDRLRALTGRHEEAIRRELGRFGRQVSGYALHRLLPENGFDVAKALVGSEGTGAVVLGATLKLVAIPTHRCLVVAAYPDMVSAAGDVPAALLHEPSALEGMGAELVDVWAARRSSPVPAELPAGGGWLLAEISGDSDADVRERAAALAAALAGALATTVVTDAARQAALWRIREDGAGLATRTPDGREAWPGFEDAAVPPDRLASYLGELFELMDRHGRRGTVFGHFGEGCLHVRIDHDLLTEAGRAGFAAFTGQAAALVVAYGGSVSGEHGDGQARSALLPLMYSAEIIGAFAEFKGIWDPAGLLNPGILIAPKALTADLRAPAVRQGAVPVLAFADDGGDFGRAVRRCVGVGKCRSSSGGVMCPSFRATGDEKDSTRGRARVLQEMLDGRTVTDGYRSEEVLDALDLCLGCKGCRTDCPVGVDMAAYKTEFLNQHFKGRPRPRAHYSLGWLPMWARGAAVAPRAVNRLLAGPLAPVVKKLGGIAVERDLPAFAERTFTSRFRRGAGGERGGRGVKVRPGIGDRLAADDRPTVVLWPDTFVENFAPEIGVAAVAVLRDAGFRVLLPPRVGCCGLTWISTGQLGMARRVLRHTLDLLEPALAAGLPIVVLEPSCAVALRTELPELLPDDARSRPLADSVLTLAGFLARHAPDWEPPLAAGRRALVQVHCHQYATGGPGRQEAGLLSRMGIAAEILDAGCCGLAGDFGVVEGHYDVSMAVAELGLLPAVRASSPETLIIADGFSCRTQIAHGAPGRRAVHLAEVLAQGLAPRRHSRG